MTRTSRNRTSRNRTSRPRTSRTRTSWPLAAAFAVLALPASAQAPDRDVPLGGMARNEAECIAQFQAADQNGDGLLSAREMSDARGLLPTSLSMAGDWVSRHDFLSACRAGFEVQKGAG